MNQKSILKPGERELLKMLDIYKAESFLEVANKMGLCRRTIMRYLRKLESLGYLNIDRDNWKKITLKSIDLKTNEEV